MSGSDAPNSVVQGYRLSPQQERVWLLERSAQSTRPFARCRVILDGSLDPAVLKISLEDILQRHEILRTTLQFIPGMTLPVQVIAEHSALSHQEFDLTGRMPNDQECQIESLLRGLQKERADSLSGSSMHTILIKLSDVKHLLVIDLPGYCVDGVTFKNLIRELEASHEAYAQGVSAVLDDPLQYADFAEWQHSLLSDEAGQVGRTYWRRQAEAIVGPLGNRLPFERALSDGVHLTLKRIPIAISKKCLGRVDSLVEQKTSASSTFFLACWHILLQRLIGQEDMVVGVACDGRTHDEMRNAFGPFARYLPVLTRLDQDLPFRTALERLQQAVAEAYEWQEYFTWEDIQNTTIRGDAPYFPFCFEFEEEQSSGTNATPSFRIESKETYLDRFKIRLVCHRKDGLIDAILEYDESYYPDEVMACLAKQLETLVSQAACQPEAAIGDIETLGEMERHQVLHTFNVCPPQERCDQCLHHLFEAQSAHAPDNIALVYEGQSFTYRELDRRANQLAHYLKSQGVGPETAVGICVERSPELIVGLLGILKAGGAYVPIDPLYPKDRRDYLLEDSRAPILLIQNRFREEFLGTPVSIVSIDSETQPFEEYSELKPSTHETPDGVAYIIYTSGSTGRPKGVLVTHRNAVHSTRARLAYYKHPVTSFLLLSSFAFDSSVAGIFWTLSQGGRLCLVREGVQKAPLELGTLIEHAQVTHLLCLPSLYSVLLEQVPVTQLNSLRTIIVAGESCPKDLVARHQANLPFALLFNEYGPTEGTVWSTVHRTSVLDEGATVSIGRPIAGVRIYILDAHMRPVSIGMLGDLYIAGEGLTRAYHGRPDLTASKFIPNPFSPVAGGRLYRTGDLARYRPNGTIEFAGRGDQQVKIRGYRIELGEIEARLLEHPAVQDATVLVREAVTGDMLMVAYVVQRDNSQDTTALREFLKERLPEYMIPSATVVLTRFPLTPNGKVDRKALPMPDVIGQLAHQYVAPRSPTEELLCGIWANVLQVAQVGVDDNFFDLGGHSLLATQVMARLREVFRVDLPMRVLFETATVAKLAVVLASFKTQELGLEEPPIISIERGGKSIPLSFAQQRLWVLTQIDQNDTSYHIPLALRLSGALDTSALERSFSELICRHEVLRTTFAVVDGTPIQMIAPSFRMFLPVIDLTHLTGVEQETAVRRLAASESQRPFELAYGPMIRASLLRLRDDEHVLLLTMHHIVSDAWSADIIVREVTTLYEDHIGGRPSSLPDLTLQYADFSLWQRQWLSGERMERQLSYWKDVLSGELPLLELPTDHPRPALRTSHGAFVTSALTLELSAAVKEFSRREGVTQYMALLAAFYLLLFRYSGQQDLIVGSPIANRTRKEIEGLIGFFVNTLALRIDVSGNPTIREVIARVRHACLGAYSHQDVPFEKLVEVLQPIRDVSRSPLFQVMFDMQNLQPSEVALRGLSFAPLEMENQTAKFDLTMTVQEAENGLVCSIEYNTDLFDEPTIQRMLTHYQTLLEKMVTLPEGHISELPLLPKDEQQQILVDWNNTTRAYPQGKCLHELIEAQVDKTPDAVAVVCENQSLTYRELNQRANQLACYLRQQGVGTDVLVGVCMERSVEMVVSLLGILKAGGAYVPMDPDYPQDRIAFMLADTQPVLLLTQRDLVSKHKSYAGHALCLDTDWSLIAQQPTMNLQTSLSPQNLAYTIYTSGSTGRPKGVGNTHLGLLNRLQWMQDSFHLRATDRVLQKTPFSFDVSVWEFFWPLMVGAGLVVAGPGEHRNPARLIELITQHRVTTIHFVPPMLHVFLETAGVDSCCSLRRIICSGEALSAELQRRCFMQLGWVELHNLYGPTEAAIDVTAWLCKRDDEAISVPIGRPIANTQMYVLDQENQPVPIGVPGELHIGGVGVARGYHHRPELTAEKFVPDPFSEIPGSRLYKTGDVARYRQDGVIDYMGRLDHQVKIRGFRIELGEIEAWLSKYSTVREVVVLAREGQPDGKRLVAYVVSDGIPSQPIPTANDLRQFLSEQLPEYMIPAAVLFLAELPRTANGKIDRKSLPAPDFSSQAMDQYVAPRTAMESKLAGLWAEVLNVKRIGVYDNFFDLGGHSLLAVQLMSRIRKSTGGPSSLLTIFQAPTVASLAELLSNSRQDVPSSVVALRETGTRLPLYCFDPDGTHVLAYQPLAYSLDDEQPVYGISLSGIFSVDWKALSIEAIAEDHARLIRRHQPEGPYHLLGWSNGGVIAIAVAHALERQGQAIAFLGILDTQPRIELTENLNVLDELVAYVSRDRQHEFLALPEEERQAFQKHLVSMTDDDRVEYAIQWAQERGFLSHEESETSIDVLKIGYALDKEANRTLQAYGKAPVRAPIHAWWTSTTLSKHGKAPVDWTQYTRGNVEVGTILGEHADAVQGIEVHQRINEILTQVCDVKKESYAVQS